MPVPLICIENGAKGCKLENQHCRSTIQCSDSVPSAVLQRFIFTVFNNFSDCVTSCGKYKIRVLLFQSSLGQVKIWYLFITHFSFHRILSKWAFLMEQDEIWSTATILDSGNLSYTSFIYLNSLLGISKPSHQPLKMVRVSATNPIKAIQPGPLLTLHTR